MYVDIVIIDIEANVDIYLYTYQQGQDVGAGGLAVCSPHMLAS